MGDKLPKMITKSAVVSRVGGRLGDKKAKSGLAQTLDPVHPERYTRPDFSKWAVFKSDPSNKAEPGTLVNPNLKNMESIKGSAVPPTSSTNAEPAAPTPPPAPAGPLVPPAVAEFVGKLPHVSEYNGPIINEDEIIKIILGLPVQVPVVGVTWIPIDEYVVAPKASRDRDYGRDRSDYGRRDDRRESRERSDYRDRPYERSRDRSSRDRRRR